MLFLAKPYEVKVWHSDGSYAGWGSYTGTLFMSRDATFWKSHEERWRLSSQSQPLSFIMWDSSMMNFPSLYFWLSSNACSCRGEVQRGQLVKPDAELQLWTAGTTLSFTPNRDGHTYIFPAQCGVTVFTVDVSYCVKSREQQPLLRRTAADVHPENRCSVVRNGCTVI